MSSLVEVASAIVLPALESVFGDGEIESFTIASSGTGTNVWIELVVVGETYRDVVIDGDAAPQTEQYWRDRLTSNLADFVSESHFGWGQNRQPGVG
jgi:hypothetical protein